MIHTIRTTHEVVIAVPSKVWKAQQRDRDAAHKYKQALQACRGTSHVIDYTTMYDEHNDVYFELAKFDDLQAAHNYVAQMQPYIDLLVAVYGGAGNARTTH